MSEKALVITPTYNEKDNAIAIITAALAADPRIEMLIVDDNSPDGTGDIVEAESKVNPRVHLLRRPGKMGLGTAYRDGFKWALKNDYEYIFEMDADFSHDPAHLPIFLEAAQTADFVIGSRYLDANITVVNWPMRRLLLSYCASLYVRIITRMPLWDGMGGYKCFHRRVLAAIDLNDVRSNGYAFQVEMSFRAFRKGFKVKEIPIVFSDRTHGVSKMSKGVITEAFMMPLLLRVRALLGQI